MGENTNQPTDEPKKQISFGKLVKKSDFLETKFIPDKVKTSIKPNDYYLWIYIPGDNIIKLSIYPAKSSAIKKILIRLKEFSPDLMKGISDVLKTFKLGEATIHTTGLCFSGINCFYETYIDGNAFKDNSVGENICKEFLNVANVEDVQLLNIPVSEI